MSRVSRRELLRNGALLGVGSIAPLEMGCTTDEDPPEPLPAREVFLHGVASGDPLADAVILWTRVTVADGEPVDVFWEIAEDAAFEAVVKNGEVSTDASRDHTVKVDVDGLDPQTTYYYRFEAVEETSPIGRARTAPSGAATHLRFAVCSCASMGHGYYNAYRRMSERTDLDLVVHLGDYMYEYETNRYGKVRQLEPEHETVTLEDYRRRYAFYRLDPDLQALHRQHPMVLVWDDHETANDSWFGGAGNHSEDEGSWEDRKAAALQAYQEWLPIREQPDGRLWRKLPYGDLLDLIMLDTRIWGRDQAVADEDDPLLDDPDRTLLGEDQEAWLADQLATSTAQWKVLGQQVMVGQLPQFLNVDQWDGYPAARDRLFTAMAATTDVVVLTGDIHASFGQDLATDPFSAEYDPDTGAGSFGVEVVVPGITSAGFPEQLAALADGVEADNPHMKHVELSSRGYAVVDVDTTRVQADWFYVDTVEAITQSESHGGSVSCAAGTSFWLEGAEPAPSKADPPEPAPVDDFAESKHPGVAGSA